MTLAYFRKPINSCSLTTDHNVYDKLFMQLIVNREDLPLFEIVLVAALVMNR